MDPTDPESKLDFARRLLADAVADQSSTEIPRNRPWPTSMHSPVSVGPSATTCGSACTCWTPGDVGRTTRPGFGRAPDHPAARPRWRSTATC